jgi:hypothetical protein
VLGFLVHAWRLHIHEDVPQIEANYPEDTEEVGHAQIDSPRKNCFKGATAHIERFLNPRVTLTTSLHGRPEST